MQIHILQEDLNKLEAQEDEILVTIPRFGISDTGPFTYPETRGFVERGTCFWDRMPLREVNP